MDTARILGALMHQRAEVSGHTSRTLATALHGPPSGYAPPATGGVEGLIQGVLREALGRSGQAPPRAFPHPGAWPGRIEQHPGHSHPPHHHSHFPASELDSRSALLLRAMISAAVSDCRIDRAEQQQIISQLGYLSPDEQMFLRQEFARPLDPHTIASQTPSGMAVDVYAVSLMAICLDTNQEARHLHSLAECLGLHPQVCDQIHHRLGAPRIFGR